MQVDHRNHRSGFSPLGMMLTSGSVGGDIITMLISLSMVTLRMTGRIYFFMV